MSKSDLINPSDPPARQVEKLLLITDALMRRVEEDTEISGAAYAQFQRAAILEQEVRARTRDLEKTLDLLNHSNRSLAAANAATEAARADLANAIETVQEGFALFNAAEELVLCNSRFGMHMPDLRPWLLPGLSFIEYVTRVSRSRHLTLQTGETPDRWLEQRLEKHQDKHVVFNVHMKPNRWVQVSEHRTPDGGTVILQTDVTDIMRGERRERERMLDDQARLIRATLEHLDQGICIFDSRCRLVGWNQRMGILLQFPVQQYHAGIHATELIEWMAESFTLSGGLDAGTIQEWVRQDAHRLPLTFEIAREGRLTLSVFAQETPDRGFVISFSDVSAERAAVRAIREANEKLEERVRERTEELEAALAEAERANASKSRFVAAASHDLLQPLSAAKLFLASIEDSAHDSVNAPIVGKAFRALESVEHLMAALLDISKLDSGRAAVNVGSVSMHRLMTQLGDEMAPLAKSKGLAMRVVPSSAVVASDPTYLRRIIQNLLSNAIRYTDEGSVLLGVRHRPDTVLVQIHDTGPGIPEEERIRIFGEFQRLNAAVNPEEGMGLGLAIVDRACALLGHDLELYSTPGSGTCFSLELPLLRYSRGGSLAGPT